MVILKSFSTSPDILFGDPVRANRFKSPEGGEMVAEAIETGCGLNGLAP